MSIWNDIGPMAWGDDPLGQQYDDDAAEFRRRLAASHAASRRAAHVHADAWSIVAALAVEGHRRVLVCTDERYAEEVRAEVRRIVGTVDVVLDDLVVVRP